MGLIATSNEPESESEYDGLAKVKGACVTAANRYHRYHVWLGDIRDALLHGDTEHGLTGLEEKTKIQRKTRVDGKNSKGEDIVVWDEKEEPFMKRLCAETKKPASEYQKDLDAVCKAIPFNPEHREPKAKAPTRLDAKYKETADAVLKGPFLKKFLADLKTSIGKEFTPTGDNEKDVVALGWLVKEFSKWKEKQNLMEMVLGGKAK